MTKVGLLSKLTGMVTQFFGGISYCQGKSDGYKTLPLWQIESASHYQLKQIGNTIT